ncbi:MAG: flagellar type III secretion system pore protein FliP [Ruminococcus sp.]|jgi:flagellar biosynthetic protein FliP|nr:flagellar type III secretion system pore protein FliP [Ruminococcus sp.]
MMQVQFEVKMRKSLRRLVTIAVAAALAFMLLPLTASAAEAITTTAPAEDPNIQTQAGGTQQIGGQTQAGGDDQVQAGSTGSPASDLLEALNITSDTSTIDLILLITVLTLSPSILVMLTCFTRIVISFSLLRNAMGVQQTPPNQVMIGLTLFLTVFIMTPVINEMSAVAYEPYKNGEISAVEAFEEASIPLKGWMLRNTSNSSMDFFLELSGTEADRTTEETFINSVPFTTVVPAFILSEIKIGFQIGFLLYVPFLIIDIIVATVLMSMGMMMLPPTTVSIPFKILIFVMVDGWTLLIGSLAQGFNP